MLGMTARVEVRMVAGFTRRVVDRTVGAKHLLHRVLQEWKDFGRRG